MAETPDLIDRLAGIAPGSRLDALRGRRGVARENAQRSYQALFEPADPGTVTLEERFALASFVAALHGQSHAASHYRGGLARNARQGMTEAVEAESRRGEATGPYGRYPEGPLSREDRPGPAYTVSGPHGAALGPRLSAGLGHAHLLVFRPREASPGALRALREAGWSDTDIVTLSQIVAFLSFQVRVVAGLRAMQENPGTGLTAAGAAPAVTPA